MSEKIVAIFNKTETVQIISENVLKYIPFSSQPFSHWNDKIDLVKFLHTLYDQSAVMIGPDGKRQKVNYRFYGSTVYKHGHEKVKRIIKAITENAKGATPAPGAAKHKIRFPNFFNDEEFGKTAKYIIAWDGVVGAMLSESAFFSIAHILEADSDINCSILLLANLYYKQAMQILRNYLEDLIVTMYFCDNQKDYLAWKNNSYQLPHLRGSNGMLEKLVNWKILPKRIAGEVSDLYGALNRYVHGAENYLINRGLYTGNWMGYVFKDKDFRVWCEYMSRSIEIGIRLLKINTIQWNKSRTDNKILCDICHNDQNFKTKEYEFAGEKHIEYHCLRCGNKMTLTKR